MDIIGTLEILKTVFEIAFFAVTAYAALKALSTWKTQLKGKERYEVAKQVIVGSNRIRDAIKTCQSPAMFSFEWADREPLPNESSLERKANESYFAYMRRFAGVVKEVQKWYPAITEAEVLFGPEAREKIEQVEKLTIRLRAAIDIHHRRMLNRKSQDGPDQFTNIVYGINPDLASEGEGSEGFFDDGGFQSDLDRSIVDLREQFSKYMK